MIVMNDEEFTQYLIKEGKIQNEGEHNRALDIIWKNFDEAEPGKLVDRLMEIVADYERSIYF